MLYAAVLAGFPFASLLPTALGLPSTPFSVGFRAFVLLLATFCVLEWFTRRRPLHRGWAWLALAGFWTVYLAKMVFEVGTPRMPLIMAPAEYALFAIGVCIAPLTAMLEVPSRATLALAWRACAFTISVPTLAVLYMFATGRISIAESERLSTDIINPITLGYMGAGLIVILVARPFEWPGASRAARALLWAARLAGIAAGLAVAVASGSRGPMVALVGAMAAWIAIVPVRQPHRGRRIALRIAALVVAAVVLVILAQTFADSIKAFSPLERLTGTSVDSSLDYRQRALTGAIAQFVEHPVFGDTLLERTTIDYPHNIYVESLMAVGLVGTLPLLVFAVLAVRAALRLLRHDAAARWLALLFLMQCVASATSGAIYVADAFWCFGAACIARASVSTVSVTLGHPARRADASSAA